MFYDSCFKENVTEAKRVYLQPVLIVEPKKEVNITQNQTYDVVVRYFDNVFVDNVSSAYLQLNNQIVRPESE